MFFLWIFTRVPYRSEFRWGLVLPTAMLEARFSNFGKTLWALRGTVALNLETVVLRWGQ